MNVLSRHSMMAGLLAAATICSLSVAAPFDPLFQIGRITGTCLVQRPGIQDFEVGVEGRAYPYGSLLQTQDASEVVVYLSSSRQIRLGALSTAKVVDASGDAAGMAKEVVLEAGILGLYLPMEEAEIPLAVQTPVARFDNFKGRSELRLFREAESHRLIVATAIGEARLRGPQFAVEKLKRSSGLEIITAYDESYTGLTGKSGEYEVALERGKGAPEATGFRPGARIKIWRRRAALSGKLAVSVMIAGAEGAVQTSFAYLQGEDTVSEAVKPPDATDGATTPGVESADVGAKPQDALFGAETTPAAKPAEGGDTINEDIWNF